MLNSTELASGPGFTARDVDCPGDHPSWSPVECQDGHLLVLVRSGRFQRRADGVATEFDPTMAYLSEPGEEAQFAHPSGGDRCTAISLGADVWHEVGAGRGVVYVDAAAELAHRRLLAEASDEAAAASDDAQEALLELLCALAGPAGRVAVDPGLVTAAREAIVDDHPQAARLPDLAELLGVSPYRLSRSFSVHMGVSVTHYRNRVRVGRALDRIAGGEENLAILAADLGFADQAHLCRTLRAHVGHPPSAVRQLLARPRERLG